MSTAPERIKLFVKWALSEKPTEYSPIAAFWGGYQAGLAAAAAAQKETLSQTAIYNSLISNHVSSKLQSSG